MTEVTQAVQLEAINHLVLASTAEKPLRVSNAAYSRGHISLGDLQHLGYAKHHRVARGHNGSVSWWTYSGPTPIQVSNQIWYPGHVDDEYEKDYGR